MAIIFYEICLFYKNINYVGELLDRHLNAMLSSAADIELLEIMLNRLININFLVTMVLL